MAGLLNPCLTDVKLVCSGRGRGVASHTKQRKSAFHRLKLDHPLPSPHDDCVNIGNVVSIIMGEPNTLIARIVRACTISLQPFLLRELIDF